MAPKEFLLLLLSVFSAVLGQFFLKSGALKLGQVELSNAVSKVLNIFTVTELLVGLFFYGIGALFYILLLTRVNLSIVGPAVALTYVFSVLLGYFVFKEAIPLSRAIGLGFIVGGVLLVIWAK